VSSTPFASFKPLHPLSNLYNPRTPSHLAASLADAKAHNYALGIKLVRGAYHPHELSAHAAHGQSLSISTDAQPPVWTSKPETDECYNTCARMLVSAIKADVDSRRRWCANALPSMGVLFGTHNWDSCRLILDELVKSGLASKGPKENDLVILGDEVTERLTIGQLYG
jgi:proline dehydrogenase